MSAAPDIVLSVKALLAARIEELITRDPLCKACRDSLAAFQSVDGIGVTTSPTPVSVGAPAAPQACGTGRAAGTRDGSRITPARPADPQDAPAASVLAQLQRGPASTSALSGFLALPYDRLKGVLAQLEDAAQIHSVGKTSARQWHLGPAGPKEAP